MDTALWLSQSVKQVRCNTL